jgi:hypothetical protein
MDSGREWLADRLRLSAGPARDEEMLRIRALRWLKKLLRRAASEIGESEREDGSLSDGTVESWELHWCGCD